MDSSNKLMCPSYKCAPGAMLIGIVQRDGTVSFLGNPIHVDEQFVQITHRGRPAENRFRFAGACGQGACHPPEGEGAHVGDAQGSVGVAASAGQRPTLRSGDTGGAP